jgi:hypothetical protein
MWTNQTSTVYIQEGAIRVESGLRTTDSAIEPNVIVRMEVSWYSMDQGMGSGPYDRKKAQNYLFSHVPRTVVTHIDAPLLFSLSPTVRYRTQGRIKIAGRPDFWRASENAVNATPTSSHAKYDSSFSSGN